MYRGSISAPTFYPSDAKLKLSELIQCNSYLVPFINNDQTFFYSGNRQNNFIMQLFMPNQKN